MTERIDPELVDDRDVQEEDVAPVDLPEYDEDDFELPDDFEYVEEDEEDDTDGRMTAAMSRHVGLVDHLKKWGLDVEEIDGWRHRGRPYNFYPRAIFVHHTASGAQSGNFASQNIVVNGRTGLPGPLSQVLLGRNATVRLVAAGYSNHAGYGGPRAGIPANMGNTYAYGIEAENNGLGEPWGDKQLKAYYRLCAALLAWMKIKDVSKVFGHKEWTSRKIDPAGINMDDFREQVRKALNHGPSVKTVSLKRLQPGKRNRQVIWVKRRLKRRGFFKGNPNGKYFGKGLERAYAAYQRDLGYSGKDADGIPGRATLQKLGFRVIP